MTRLMWSSDTPMARIREESQSQSCSGQSCRPRQSLSGKVRAESFPEPGLCTCCVIQSCGDIVYYMQCQNQDSSENMTRMRLFPEYTTHAFEKNCLDSGRRFPSFSCKFSLRSRDAIDTIEGVTRSLENCYTGSQHLNWTEAEGEGAGHLYTLFTFLEKKLRDKLSRTT